MILKENTLRLTPVAFAASLLLAGQAHAVGTGTISDGNGSINKNGSTTTVNQTSDKLIVNWDNMDVAKGETLNFAQKNASSAVLNRINSANATSILGALNANGRVFVVNPNGVLIGNGAKINVGSLIASSLNISDADFKADRLNFKGGGNGNVVNEGEINAKEAVALIGSKTVSNTGTIKSQGNVVLAAGDAITLSFANTGLQARITESSLNALINNGGLIVAADGNVVLRAWARDAIARTVVNNTGTIEASRLRRTAADAGNVSLTGGDEGEVHVGGTIKANTVTADGKKSLLDGTLSANSLFLNNAVLTDNASLQAQYAKFRGGDLELTRGNYQVQDTELDVNSANILLKQSGGVRGKVSGDLRVRANQDLNFSILAGGNVDALAAGNLNVYGVEALGNVKLKAKSIGRGDGVTSVRVRAQGDMDVTADEDVTIGSLYGKTVNVRANGGAANVASISSQGNATVYGNTGLKVGGFGWGDDSVVGGDLDLATDDDANLGGEFRVGGDVKIRGKNVKTSKAGQPSSIRANGNVAVTADENVELDQIQGNTIDVQARNGKVKLGRIDSRGDASIYGHTGLSLGTAYAGRNLSLTSQGDITDLYRLGAGNDITMRARNVRSISPYSEDAIVNAGGNVSVIADEDVALTRIDSGGRIDVQAKGGAASIGWMYSAGDASVYGRTSLSLANGAQIGGNLNLTSEGDVFGGGLLASDKDITIRGKNVKIGRGSTSWRQIDAQGKLTVTADENVELGKVAGDTVDVQAKDGTASFERIDSQGDTSVYGKKGLKAGHTDIKGNLRLTSDDDVMVDGELRSANDVTIHGKSVKGTQSFVNNGVTDWSGAVRADGNVSVTADEDIGLAEVYGKNVDLRAKNGELNVYSVMSGEDAYLEGGRSIRLGARGRAGKNMTFESQGDVTLGNGVDVDGDLEYKLGPDSKVENKGQANDVKGKTIGWEAPEPDGDKKPDGGDAPEPGQRTPEQDAAFRDWLENVSDEQLESTIRNLPDAIAEARERGEEHNADMMAADLEAMKAEQAKRKAAADANPQPNPEPQPEPEPDAKPDQGGDHQAGQGSYGTPEQEAAFRDMVKNLSQRTLEELLKGMPGWIVEARERGNEAEVRMLTWDFEAFKAELAKRKAAVQ